MSGVRPAIRLCILSCTGSIPTHLGLLTALRSIRFEQNLLTGTIPTELGNLLTVKVMRWYGNELTGACVNYMCPFLFGQIDAAWHQYGSTRYFVNTMVCEHGVVIFTGSASFEEFMKSKVPTCGVST